MRKETRNQQQKGNEEGVGANMIKHIRNVYDLVKEQVRRVLEDIRNYFNIFKTCFIRMRSILQKVHVRC